MSECPNPDGSSPRTMKFSSPPPMCIDPSKKYIAEISTSFGPMTGYLHPQRSPKTVNNFVFLARYHFYDGLTFHRVINGFVIQGGCPDGVGTGGPGYRFEDELEGNVRYEVGSLAMANAGPNTNGSQFFVVSGPDGARLPPQYTPFGKLISGFEVLERIQSSRTGPADRPIDSIEINSVTITEAADEDAEE